MEVTSEMLSGLTTGIFNNMAVKRKTKIVIMNCFTIPTSVIIPYSLNTLK